MADGGMMPTYLHYWPADFINEWGPVALIWAMALLLAVAVCGRR